MTDNEIIKALECAIEYGCGHYIEIDAPTIKSTLNLIKSQKAEIKRLTKENNELKNGFFQEHYKENECQELLSVKEAWRKESLHNIDLEAEIERLKGNASKLFISDKTPSRYFKVKSQQPVLIYPYQEAKIELVPSTEQTKAEAIKDFAERLTYTLVINNEENTEFFDFSYTLETIDNLVKEMTGEKE